MITAFKSLLCLFQRAHSRQTYFLGFWIDGVPSRLFILLVKRTQSRTSSSSCCAERSEVAVSTRLTDRSIQALNRLKASVTQSTTADVGFVPSWLFVLLGKRTKTFALVFFKHSLCRVLLRGFNKRRSLRSLHALGFALSAKLQRFQLALGSTPLARQTTHSLKNKVALGAC